MSDSPNNSCTKRLQQSRHSISVVWIGLFVFGIWLIAFSTKRHVPPSGCRGNSLQYLPAETYLEKLAEYKGEYRCHSDIKAGNDLIDAVIRGDEELVRDLLNRGVDVNSRYVEICRDGETALMAASFDGNVKLAMLLLEHGADPNLERQGVSAMHLAVRGDHGRIIELLMEAGARHDGIQLRQTRQIIRAACKGFRQVPGEGFPPYPGAEEKLDSAPTIEDALKGGADVNATDPNGFTPLMYAANLGLLENVQTLLKHGANPYLKSKHGDTALSLADGSYSSVTRKGRARVVEFLRKYLAEKNTDQ